MVIVKLMKNTKNTKIFKKKQKKDFNRIINIYINIAEKDYNEFWNSYKKLGFIIDLKWKKRLNIYYNFYYYLYNEKLDKIIEKVYHFKEYKKSDDGNYPINKNFLLELQKEIFYYEEHEFNKIGIENEFEISNNDVTIIRVGFDGKKEYIIGNKVKKKLNEMYQYIENITYNCRTKNDLKKNKYKNKKITPIEYNRLLDIAGLKIKNREKRIKKVIIKMIILYEIINENSNITR